MGKARILSAQGEGRYSIEILEDRTRAESLKQRALQRIDEIDSELSGLEPELEQARQAVDAAAEVQDQAIQQHQAEIAATGESSVDLQAPAQAVLEAAAARDAIHTRIGSLNLERLQQQGWIDRVDALPPLRTQDAWCADYTEDLSGEVATAEVPGEAKQVIIKPGFEGANQWSASEDGAMQPALAGTPAGVFYNLAMMPGWQKWRPTFRIATISNINNDLCDITLDPATSSQQGLNVNAQGSYSGVPIYYMDCNGAAFEDGDRVLVAFSGNTEQPMVVGFELEPRRCFDEFSGSVDFLRSDYFPIPVGTTRTGPALWSIRTELCPLSDVDPVTRTFSGSYTDTFDHPFAIPKIVIPQTNTRAMWLREDMTSHTEKHMHKTMNEGGDIECTVSAETDHVTEASPNSYHEFTIKYTLSVSGEGLGNLSFDDLEFCTTAKMNYVTDFEYTQSGSENQFCSVMARFNHSGSFECVLPDKQHVVFFDVDGRIDVYFIINDGVGVVLSPEGVLYVTLSLRRFFASGTGRNYILYAVAPDGQQALCDYSGFWQSSVRIGKDYIMPPAGRPLTFVQDEGGSWEPFYG